MSNQKRREVILALLEENGKVYVNELAKEMEVSEKTIRRDLTKMEKEGLLVRSHGGAMHPDKVELPNDQIQKASEKSDGDRADKSDEGFAKNEDIKIAKTSKPEWLIKAIENTKPDATITSHSLDINKEKNTTSAGYRDELLSGARDFQSTFEEIEISQSGNIIEPIKSLKDINLKELEKSISPETLEELMRLANSDILMGTERVSNLNRSVVDKELENEELAGEGLEGEELDDEELEGEELDDEELEGEELDDEELEGEELDDEELKGEELEDEELDNEELEDEEPEKEGLKDEQREYEEEEFDELIDGELGDEDFEDENSVAEELYFEDEDQYYDVTEAGDGFESARVSDVQRLNREYIKVDWQESARKTKSSYTQKDKRSKPSERNKTTGSKGRTKSRSDENTKKSSTIGKILDWLHIIIALIIFIGGIILSFYIIQTNRAQNLIINEGNIINESVISDDMSYYLTVDEHLLESANLQIRILVLEGSA